MYLPYDSKKEVLSHPHGAPERPRPKVFGPGCFVGVNVWMKENGKDQILGEETTELFDVPSVGENVAVVEASIINAHSPFPGLLFNKNRIGMPVGVEYLSDESGCQEFGDLLMALRLSSSK